jgi:PDGLE domain
MKQIRMRLVIGFSLAVALGLAVLASPYASSSPDGLEKVAETNEFLADGRLHSLQESSPVPDYAFPGIDDPRLATALAGLFGTLLVAVAGTAVLLLARRRSRAV